MGKSGSNSIMIVGNWHWEIYEEGLARGFKQHGWTVIKFNTDHHLPFSSLDRNLFIRARLSPFLLKLNRALLKSFLSREPSAVFIYRSDFIFGSTLRKMKQLKPDTVLLMYHNDNPYVGFLNRIKMRHFLRGIAKSDVTFVYRPSNVDDARKYKAKRVEVLMPYYLSYLHRPGVADCEHDVVFVGHYAPDGRAEYIDHLIYNGVRVSVFGHLWEKAPPKYKWLQNMEIKRLTGKEYVKTLLSSKIALVFLSSKHRDIYTRRCFEIPACGTLMISPRTPDLQMLFDEDKEIVFFESKQDLLDKVTFYLNHDKERMEIAQAGRNRCIRDGHDEKSRALKVIGVIKEVKCSNE